MWSVTNGSVMNVVCYEQVSFERTPSQWIQKRCIKDLWKSVDHSQFLVDHVENYCF